MIVVAIIALLAAISLPKFANITLKAREAAVKGKLSAFRGAIKIYYSDTEGMFPQAEDALVPRYIEEIPSISLPSPINHPPTNEVTNTLDDWATNRAWYYNGLTGDVHVNCTHTDTKNIVWSDF